MKLLFFINSLSPGGAERVISKLANHAAEEGHEVSLATLTPIVRDHYRMHPDVARISLNAGQVSTGVISAILNNIKRYWRVTSLFRRLNPDRVIAFMPTASVLAVLASLKIVTARRPPVIAAERTHPAFDTSSRLRLWFKGFAYRRAMVVTVLSQAGADWLRDELGIINTRIIPNGISLPLAHIEPEVDPGQFYSEEEKLIMFVGRINEPKQPLVLFSAFETLADAHEEWRLVFIGSGDEDAGLADSINRSRHAGKIRHVERVGNMGDWYTRAAIFVSVSRVEGWPNALMEAMAHGCTVVAFDCLTGPSDLIENERNGILLPLGEPGSGADRVAEVLIDCARDQKKAARLGRAARQVALDYSDDVFFQNWMDCIQDHSS